MKSNSWKKFVLIVASAAALSIGVASRAYANELWIFNLPNGQVGVPSGALPPPGVYGSIDNYFALLQSRNDEGKKIQGDTLRALIEFPFVEWVPGMTILGGSYGAALGQPFDYTNYEYMQQRYPGAGNMGLYNTVVEPLILSWMLPDHLFASVNAAFFLPDATTSMADFVKGDLKNGGLPSGNGYASVMPGAAFTWLYNGWDITANFRVVIPLGSTKVNEPRPYNYRTGDQFLGDYTVEKTVGHWNLGVGFSQQNQIQKDTFNGQSAPGTVMKIYTVGPFVGYQFIGGIQVTLLWAHVIAASSTGVSGDGVDLRLQARF